MARPIKNSLDYFPLDVGFFDDHKLLMIEEEHGVRGGYLAVRLIGMVYKEGYYLNWEASSPFATAKKVGNGYTGNEVESILKSCLKYGLFDQQKFDEFSILTSRGIQKRWVHVMNAIRRKVEVSAVYSCISSQKPGVSSEETPLPATLMRQMKGKERKGKESSSPADKPQAPKKTKKVTVKKSEKEESEPYWARIMEIWFLFNEEKFGGRPSFQGRDARELKKLIQLLKARARLKGVEWTEAAALQRFIAFLEEAFADPWLKTHFLLNNLVNQFDKIILNHQQHATNRKNTGGAVIPITGGKSAGAIELIGMLKAEIAPTGNA